MMAWRPLNVSTACSIMRATPGLLVTESELATALPAAALISRTTISAGPAEPSSPPATPPPRSLTTTLAPSRAASSAHSLPMPFAAPVTRTTLPSSTPMRLPPLVSSGSERSGVDNGVKAAETPWQIRSERPEDAPLVDALVAASFGPGRFAKSAYRLREGVAPLASLGFVAIENGVLRGSGTRAISRPRRSIAHSGIIPRAERIDDADRTNPPRQARRSGMCGRRWVGRALAPLQPPCQQHCSKQKNECEPGGKQRYLLHAGDAIGAVAA